MRTFKCLQYLDDKKIKYYYTPFVQGATLEILNEDWQGSCGILGLEWLIKKASVLSMQEVVSYSITDSHLPHPLVVGDNNPANNDEFIRINAVLRLTTQGKRPYELTMGEKKIENNFLTLTTSSPPLNKRDKIQALINYMGSKKYHYGKISTTFYIRQKDDISDKPKPSSHLNCFVKRDDYISYFDSNYGEITFDHFTDFSVWFKKEVEEGSLVYLILNHEEIVCSQLFPQPTFSQEEINTNTLSQRVTKQRIDKHLEESIAVKSKYRVHSFFSERYKNPKNITVYSAMSDYLGNIGQENKHDFSVLNNNEFETKRVQYIQRLLFEFDYNQEPFDVMLYTLFSMKEKQNFSEYVAQYLGYLSL